jgi:uncharacterized membrane protein (DUF2068 family)
MGKLKTRSKPAKDRSEEKRSYVILWMIAGFKVFKGLLLLVVAIGVLTLINENVAQQVAQWAAVLGVDPNNYYLHRLLVKLTGVDNSKLEKISAGSFLYSALLLTEGVGLFLRRRWAEYLTVFITGSLIPIEIYELVKKFSATKVIVLAINVAVVIYLAVRLVRGDERRTA